jgi:hypothetical protein
MSAVSALQSVPLSSVPITGGFLDPFSGAASGNAAAARSGSTFTHAPQSVYLAFDNVPALDKLGAKVGLHEVEAGCMGLVPACLHRNPACLLSEFVIRCGSSIPSWHPHTPPATWHCLKPKQLVSGEEGMTFHVLGCWVGGARLVTDWSQGARKAHDCKHGPAMHANGSQPRCPAGHLTAPCASCVTVSPLSSPLCCLAFARSWAGCPVENPASNDQSCWEPCIHTRLTGISAPKQAAALASCTGTWRVTRSWPGWPCLLSQ